MQFVNAFFFTSTLVALQSLIIFLYRLELTKYVRLCVSVFPAPKQRSHAELFKKI